MRSSVEFGDHRYRLERGSSAAELHEGPRGAWIVLKNEQLGLDEWIDALARDLSKTAEQSERGRWPSTAVANE